MDRLKTGEFFPADVELIAKAKGVRAIPDLKTQFKLTQDTVLKGSVASALVRLGDKDPEPWDYLVEGATDAITSDAPDPQRFDSKGNAIRGLSPEIRAWAKSHNLSDSDLDNKMFEFSAKVAFLAKARDRRAIPLLRQALLSSNRLIEALAADGLAQLQDKASIPLIIQACQLAPAGAAIAIARPLLDFDDPQAQSAAKEFRPPRKMRSDLLIAQDSQLQRVPKRGEAIPECAHSRKRGPLLLHAAQAADC